MLRTFVCSAAICIGVAGNVQAEDAPVDEDCAHVISLLGLFLFGPAACGPDNPFYWDILPAEHNGSTTAAKNGYWYRLTGGGSATGVWLRFGPIKSGTQLTAPVPHVKSQGIGASDALSDRTGRFEYVALSGSDKIAAYRIDPAMRDRADVPGAPFAAGKAPSGLAIHPANTFLYATNALSDSISAYRIDASTGALTSVGTFATGAIPQSATVDRSGRFVYVTSASGGAAPPSVQGYRIDDASGALAALGNAIPTGNFPDSIATHPFAPFVYLTSSGRVEGFRIGQDGALTTIPGSPFAAGGAVRLAFGGLGKFLYTANADANSVSGFTIDPATGALTPIPGSPFASGTHPSWIIGDSSNTAMIVSNTGSLAGGSDSISVFAVDSATGALRHIAGSPFATDDPDTEDAIARVPVRKASFAQLNAPYASNMLGVANGTSPYTWSLASGALPPGIALDPHTGTLSGTPTAEGTFAFSLKVGDAAGASFTRAYFITVNSLGTPGNVPLPAPPKQLAIEFFHAGFGHYFITTLTDEITKLDSGVFAGWARTGEAFSVYSAPGAGLVPVCRFFTTAFPPSSSHFYAPRGLGCEGTLNDHNWQFEGDVFFTALPDAAGACPSGSSPVFRLYNNGQGGAPNHRFTTKTAIRSQMLAQGYIAEGTGIGVGMCSPD